MNSPRVGIVGILQESNTFISGRTTLDHFRADLFLTGDEIRERMIDAPHEVGGFFEGLAANGIDAVSVFLARALPYGVIEGGAFDALVNRLLKELEKAGRLDGILAAPHGATVAENHPDADGYWLGELRRAAGPGLPIIATIDPHANLSSAMVAATDAIVAYATNPHLDQRETGIAAANLIARMLRGEIRPTQAAAFPPMAINIQSQDTSSPPLSDFYERASALTGDNTLSHSVVLGFPYADVLEMGSAVIVVTNDDPALAESLANRIGDEIWACRRDFEPEFTGVAEAVAEALASDESPVVLLDMGDNVGGGSPGDGTTLLAELHARRSANSFVCICDPGSVAAATKAGPGAELSLTVGAKNDGLHGDPFVATFRIRSFHDGKFTEREARHGGFTDSDQGPTAVVESVEAGITIMLTTRRMPPFSLAQLTTFGIDPGKYRIIVAKGVIAPLAAYRPVAGRFIHVDTPGVTRADMTRLAYHHRRKPLFPFEDEA